MLPIGEIWRTALETPLINIMVILTVLLGGSYEQSGHSMGFFQEADQLTPLRPFAKYAERVESIERIPIYVAEAVKKALYGTPGPAYLDLPGDIIATGTPAGVGMGLKPPRYLKAGDVVRVEIDGIGHIENRFV